MKIGYIQYFKYGKGGFKMNLYDIINHRCIIPINLSEEDKFEIDAIMYELGEVNYKLLEECYIILLEAITKYGDVSFINGYFEIQKQLNLPQDVLDRCFDIIHSLEEVSREMNK